MKDWKDEIIKREREPLAPIFKGKTMKLNERGLREEFENQYKEPWSVYGKRNDKYIFWLENRILKTIT